jgi:hypothetical protein
VGDFLGLALGVTSSTFANPFQAAGVGIAVAGLGAIGGLCYLAGGFTFILFLRAVALAIKRRDLAGSLKIFLIIVCSLGALAVLVGGVAIAVVGVAASSSGAVSPSPGGPPPSAFVGGALAFLALVCIGGVVGLGMSIWYIILLVQVRGAVLEYASRRG